MSYAYRCPFTMLTTDFSLSTHSSRNEKKRKSEKFYVIRNQNRLFAWETKITNELVGLYTCLWVAGLVYSTTGIVHCRRSPLTSLRSGL